jgi:hypothetical protein
MSRRVFGLLASSTFMAWLGTQPLMAQGNGQIKTVPHVSNSSHAPKASLTVSQRIRQNTKLADRLKPLLGGMPLDEAAAGFKNQGLFIAALHVSQNLNIPFADLKATMLGTKADATTSGPAKPESLGRAIHDLKPTADATSEAHKADVEAQADLKATSKTANHDGDKK